MRTDRVTGRPSAARRPVHVTAHVMTRRTFLYGSLHAAWLGPIAARAALAQAPVTRQLVLDVNSRSLQWLRTADEVAKATIEIACGGVCVHVGPQPAHVDPARVAQQLPSFVSQLRARGVKVTQIKGPAITDVSEPNTEAIVGAAAQAGITHYSLGGYAYDLKKPLGPQLEAIKPRLERFVRLNERHRIKLVYDTAAGAPSVGGVILDLLPIMKMFDPRCRLPMGYGQHGAPRRGMWETGCALRDVCRGRRLARSRLDAGPGRPVKAVPTPVRTRQWSRWSHNRTACTRTPGAPAKGGCAGGTTRAGPAAAAAPVSPAGRRPRRGRTKRRPANSRGRRRHRRPTLYRWLDGEMPAAHRRKNVKGAG